MIAQPGSFGESTARLATARARRGARSRAAQHGVSLIELVMTVALVAVLAGLAVPSMRAATLGSDLRGEANELISAVYLARMEAFKRNANVTLCASDSGTGCSGTNWNEGWVVVTGGTVLKHHNDIPDGYRISTTGTLTASYVFDSTGATTTPGDITVCRYAPSAGKQERIVRIDASGRARVRRTTAGVCP